MVTALSIRLRPLQNVVADNSDLDDFVRYTATTGGSGGSSNNGGRSDKGWYIVIAIFCILYLVGKYAG